ncbi:MAG TPA: O-antigen ligase family protein [Solirubrobacteraceae bacterium]|nr:O-antigen ligase family protein [Solirubrobacteraceae bacterium]
MTIFVGATLAAAAFVAGGGLALGRLTTVEVSLTLLAGLVCAVGLLVLPARAGLPGGSSLAWFGLLVVWTALSVQWSVQPDTSWQEAGLTLSYAASFALAATLARLMPQRWGSVLGGIALGGVIVCAYALLTKVDPAHLDANDTYARLRAPYNYWNAIGLNAAMTVVPCLWLGARRTGSAVTRVLAYPALGLALVTLMLAYSRGALLVLGIECAAWFIFVPLRLRAAALCAAAGVAAGGVVAWDFSQATLTGNNVDLSQRTASGLQLGILLIAMIVVLLLAGMAIGFITARRPPSAHTRRRAGIAILLALALVPVAVVGALAASHRGLFGTIHHDLHTLTNANAVVPNTPGRLTAVASVRARYWSEALKAWKLHPVIGNGAGGYGTVRLRFRTDSLNVQQAHGYVVQTLCDLGIVGMVISLGIAGAWLLAAGRLARPLGLVRRRRLRFMRRREEPFTAERVGQLTMIVVVLGFAVHSLIDWTWFIPGDALVAMLCAGWLAGAAGRPRGPAWAPADQASARRLSLDAVLHAKAPRQAAALVVLVVALLAAWTEWQPDRSADAASAAGIAFTQGRTAQALADLRHARSEDPLSSLPLWYLSAIQQAEGHNAAARASLQQAVRLQPSNPATWTELAEFDLGSAGTGPATAIQELGPALFLNPLSPEVVDDFVTAYRALHPGQTVTTSPVTPP